MSDLGNKEIFAKNLKYYMELNQKDRNDICKDLNFPYTTFAEWDNGKIYPRIDKIEMIANYFNIKKSDLIENKNKLDKFGNSVVSIPLVGDVRAGYNYLAEENWQGTKEIKAELAKTGDFFALRIKGNSMFETLWDGDIVAIKKQDFANDGDIAVVIINGDEATVKKIRILDNGIKLIPLNRRINPETQEPYFEDVFFSKEDIETKPVRIIGIVKQLIERNF